MPLIVTLLIVIVGLHPAIPHCIAVDDAPGLYCRVSMGVVRGGGLGGSGGLGGGGGLGGATHRH